MGIVLSRRIMTWPASITIPSVACWWHDGEQAANKACFSALSEIPKRINSSRPLASQCAPSNMAREMRSKVLHPTTGASHTFVNPAANET